MKIGTLIVAVAAAALGFSPAAHSATVVITAFGTITSTTTNTPDYWPDYEGPFALGAPITATLSYNTNAIYGVVPVHDSVTGYYPASGVITTGDWSREAWSYFSVGTSDISFIGPADSRYASSFPLFTYSASLSFLDPFAAIPPSSIDSSAFLSGTMTGLYAVLPIQDSSFTARIDRITALATPLPGSAWLLASALACIAALGRVRQARRAGRVAC